MTKEKISISGAISLIAMLVGSVVIQSASANASATLCQNLKTLSTDVATGYYEAGYFGDTGGYADAVQFLQLVHTAAIVPDKAFKEAGKRLEIAVKANMPKPTKVSGRNNWDSKPAVKAAYKKFVLMSAKLKC